MKKRIVFVLFGVLVFFLSCSRSPLWYESRQETVENDIRELDVSDIIFTGTDDQNSVTGDFSLPTTGESGNPITWTSSDPFYVSLTDGNADVNPPGYFEEDITVTLTGTVTIGDTSASKEIDIVILRAPAVTEIIKKAPVTRRIDYDSFGYSVSISGMYIVTGVPFFDQGSGIVGDNHGDAYVLENNGTGNWNKEMYLTDISQVGDNFGSSISISGDYAIVGSPGDDSKSINGGSVYIFERDKNGKWNQIQKIWAAETESDDAFGQSVSISGNYAIVGAALHKKLPIPNYYSGAAYIFERDSTGTWNEKEVLHPANYSDDDQFGYSVSISGDYAIIGAVEEDGDDLVDVANNNNYGAVYFYKRDSGGNWNIVEIFRPPNTATYLGWSVSISGRYAIAGGMGDGTKLMTCGVYIFERDSSGLWSNKVQRLLPSDISVDDRFGLSVSVKGDYALVGAYNGDSSLVADSGTAYLYKRDSSGIWKQHYKFEASVPQSNDQFGYSVSFDNGTAVVGAKNQNGGTAGSGAVYIYH